MRFIEDYINAFNAMENELKRIYAERQQWQIECDKGVVIRHILTDTIKMKIADSPNKRFAYPNYTNLIYRTLFGKTANIRSRRKIMVKTKIIETTEKYDKDGKLVERITREETSDDNTDYRFSLPKFDLGGALPLENTKTCTCGGDSCHKCTQNDNPVPNEFELLDDGSIRIMAENVFINQRC